MQVLHFEKKKKKTRPQVNGWDLKSSMPSKQILGILKSLGLLSKLAIHQLRKQINLSFSFLNLHQMRVDDWIKSFNSNKINKLWCIAYHRNNMRVGLAITWFGFIKILDDVLYNFYLTMTRETPQQKEEFPFVCLYSSL